MTQAATNKITTEDGAAIEAKPEVSAPTAATESAPVGTPADSGAAVPDLAAKVEAILLSTPRPAPVRKIGIALGMIRETEEDLAGEEPEPKAASAPEAGDAESEAPAAPAPKKRRRAKAESADAAAIDAITDAIASLNTDYERTGRAFRIEEVAGGYRVLTLPAFAPAVAAYQKSRQSSRLTRASIETLAIIAYRQPITRAELEAIRGVSCGEVLRSLMERRLVTMKGRAEEVGRPMLYGTTKQFLDVFGLASIKDLPTIQELKLPT